MFVPESYNSTIISYRSYVLPSWNAVISGHYTRWQLKHEVSFASQQKVIQLTSELWTQWTTSTKCLIIFYIDIKNLSHKNSAMEQHKWHNYNTMTWDTYCKGLYTIFPWWEALRWNLWPDQKYLEIPPLQNPSNRTGHCWGSHCHYHPKKETIHWG